MLISRIKFCQANTVANKGKRVMISNTFGMICSLVLMLVTIESGSWTICITNSSWIWTSSIDSIAGGGSVVCCR